MVRHSDPIIDSIRKQLNEVLPPPPPPPSLPPPVSPPPPAPVLLSATKVVHTLYPHSFIPNCYRHPQILSQKQHPPLTLIRATHPTTPMAEDSGDAKPPVICLPLSITISVHHTLLLLLQSPEPEIAIAACKALLAFARDEEVQAKKTTLRSSINPHPIPQDGATQIRTSPWSPGFQVEPIQILQRLLSHDEAELEVAPLPRCVQPPFGLVFPPALLAATFQFS
jgi:hypothetical protein